MHPASVFTVCTVMVVSSTIFSRALELLIQHYSANTLGVESLNLRAYESSRRKGNLSPETRV